MYKELSVVDKAREYADKVAPQPRISSFMAAWIWLVVGMIISYSALYFDSPNGSSHETTAMIVGALCGAIAFFIVRGQERRHAQEFNSALDSLTRNRD